MRDNFLVYENTVRIVRNLPEEEQLKFYNAMFNYVFYNQESELTGHTMAYFELTKPYIDSDNKRYENGCKGGRPRDDDSPRKEIDGIEYVILTENQYKKICEKFGDEVADKAISILDSWLAINGKTQQQYIGKNNYGHFRADTWVIKNALKAIEEEKKASQPNWSI